MLKKILIAYDGSEQALKTFDYALELMRHYTAQKPEIHVLAVAQPPEPPDIFVLDDVIAGATRHYLEHFQNLHDRARAQHLEIVTEAAVGHPAEQIIRYAKEHDIDTIFIGHTGKSKIETWLLGSVSKRIAIYAHCTVTIVK